MNVYKVEDEITSPKFAKAFAKGCGGRVLTEYAGGGWAGFGSPVNWNDLQQAIATGHDWYYGDHGYFERGQFYRVTKNAYQHTGIGVPNFRRLSRWYQRAAKFHKSGGNIIICPQSQSHLDRHGASNWLEETLDVVHRHTDREVIVRWKNGQDGPLVKQLPKAWAVVCHSSNAAVEALMHGVPVFVTSPIAAAFRMGKSNLAEIEYPYYPDGRYEWAGVLAANQWTMAEIERGLAWRAMKG